MLLFLYIQYCNSVDIHPKLASISPRLPAPFRVFVHDASTVPYILLTCTMILRVDIHTACWQKLKKSTNDLDEQEQQQDASESELPSNSAGTVLWLAWGSVSHVVNNNVQLYIFCLGLRFQLSFKKNELFSGYQPKDQSCLPLSTVILGQFNLMLQYSRNCGITQFYKIFWCEWKRYNH